MPRPMPFILIIINGIIRTKMGRQRESRGEAML
jgi:hypothetical protein